MTSQVLQPQDLSALNQTSTSTNAYDLGQQILYILKFAFYGLVLLKIFQLTFLKYRRKLAISARIEKRYKYSHNELIDNYSEDQTKLMKTTITNTIKNTEVKKSKKLSKSKTLTKSVSFDTQKNSYHQPKPRNSGEFNYTDQEGSVFTKKELESIKSNKNYEIESQESQKMKGVIVEILEKQNRGEQHIQIIFEPKTESAELFMDLSSKITQQTQASSLLDSNILSQSMKNNLESEDQFNECQSTPLSS